MVEKVVQLLLGFDHSTSAPHPHIAPKQIRALAGWLCCLQQFRLSAWTKFCIYWVILCHLDKTSLQTQTGVKPVAPQFRIIIVHFTLVVCVLGINLKIY